MTGLVIENPNNVHQFLTTTLLAQVTHAARVQAVFQRNIAWFERHGSFLSRPISGRGYRPQETAPTDTESAAAAGDPLSPTVHRHCPAPYVGNASTGRRSSSLLYDMGNSEERMLFAFFKHADLFEAIKQLLQGLRCQHLTRIF